MQDPFKLTVKVISASLTRDTDLVGKMEPYPVLKFTPFGDLKPFTFKGQPQKGADKDPVWDWEITHLFSADSINVDNNLIEVSVWEEDVTQNELIGESAKLELSTLISKKGPQTVSMAFEGKTAGEVKMEVLLQNMNEGNKAVGFQNGKLIMEVLSAELTVSSEMFSK